jgi:hypothetical protein
MRIDGLKVTGGVLLLAIAGLFYWAVRASGGLPVPASPFTEPFAFTSEGRTPVQPNLTSTALTSGLSQPVYTQHRYPRICGQELTTVIHYGHSRASVPSTQDYNWIVAPPSEVTI